MCKCISCRLEVDDSLTNCPLCGRFINDSCQASPFAYPNVDKSYVWKNSVLALLRSIMISAVLICGGINFFILIFNGNSIIDVRQFWSLYVLVSALVINYTILMPIEHGSFFWKEIILSFFFYLLFLLFIDFFTADKPPWGWSVTWVIPLMICIISLVFFIFNLSGKTDPAGSVSALFVMLIFAGVVFSASIVFYTIPDLFGKAAVLPSFIALCETACFSIILGVLRRKALKKKFHF